MPNGLYKDELGRQLEKTDDYVRIVDSVLAGSVMLMNRQLRILIKRMDVSLQDAIYMATIVPARIIGAEAKGSLEPEKDADIIVIDDDLNVHLAYCRGVLAYSSDSKD
jgi:N-acetylglucosamine-6-phosphate deacetylase